MTNKSSGYAGVAMSVISTKREKEPKNKIQFLAFMKKLVDKFIVDMQNFIGSVDPITSIEIERIKNE